MRHFRLSGPLLLLGLLAALAPRLAAQGPPVMQSAYGEKIHVAGVPVAGKINDRLYRGAQPTAAAFSELKKLGVTTIVDLRREHDNEIAAERLTVEAQGLRF